MLDRAVETRVALRDGRRRQTLRPRHLTDRAHAHLNIGALLASPRLVTGLRAPVDPDRDHIKGSPAATVTIVEYADFQCPQCARTYWVLKDLEGHVRDLQIVFRHFPIGSIHHRSVPLAEAAQAAGLQGRFWQMHDLLFENYDRLSRHELVACARAVSLELPAFEGGARTHTLLPQIREDFFGGVRSGVNRTPCLFINGWRYEGVLELEALITSLQRARQDPITDVAGTTVRRQQ